MCGIIGTTNLNLSSDALGNALSTIINRGPDNQNLIRNGIVHFGHTRLAIIDLDSRSNQPFKFGANDREILLTFNGEIYNYPIIKEKLERLGYLFKTNSDTEVVAGAYIEYGTKCFDLFEGMWAIAINDGDDLILSRDRVGKKPLYYNLSSGGEVNFGSSLNGVSILSGETDLSKKALELYFALGFIPGKFSIYENIYKVQPGKVLTFRKNLIGGFDLVLRSKSEYDVNQNKNKGFKSHLKAAIEKRLLSDVPVATLMSGGVDSIIISSMVHTESPSTESFFVDFDDEVLSEKLNANYLASRNNINLKTFQLKSKDLEKYFLEYYRVFEEPFADYSGIPSTAIFKEVSNKYRVVLTGDGGDELFYGYPHYYKKFFLFKFFRILKYFSILKILPTSISSIVSGKKENFESNYLRNHGIVTEFSSKYIDNHFNKYIEQSGSFLKGIISYDREFYNWPEKYLVKVDRSSMYSGVEVRSPFMDEALLDYVRKIPAILLFSPYSPKLFLKLNFFSLFGWKYLFSKKKGFTPPIVDLRQKYFKESNFSEVKDFIKNQNPTLFKEFIHLNYENLLRDKILFDRFFFFNEWRKSFNKNKFSSKNKIPTYV